MLWYHLTYLQTGSENISVAWVLFTQVNFLVFPGTSGSRWLDYLVADAAVAPPEHVTRQVSQFSEKIVYLPDTYQANYYGPRALAQATNFSRLSDTGLGFEFVCVFLPCHWNSRLLNMSWTQARRLHDDTNNILHAFSCRYCNFNKIDKIEPDSFGVWASILRRVPGSALWLLKPSSDVAFAAVKTNLAAEMVARGIDARRVVWADRVSKRDHLERHRHCDLFLDSFHYNAHSTATDAL